MLKSLRKIAFFGSVIVSTFGALPAVAAGFYSGTVSGYFTAPLTTGAFINTDGSVGNDANGADAVYGGIGTSAIYWGATGGQPGFASSTLSFTGDNFTNKRSFDPEAGLIGQIFKIGTLSYYNGTGVTGSLLYGATLHLDVNGATVLNGQGLSPISIDGLDLSLERVEIKRHSLSF